MNYAWLKMVGQNINMLIRCVKCLNLLSVTYTIFRLSQPDKKINKEKWISILETNQGIGSWKSYRRERRKEEKTKASFKQCVIKIIVNSFINKARCSLKSRLFDVFISYAFDFSCLWYPWLLSKFKKGNKAIHLSFI